MPHLLQLTGSNFGPAVPANIIAVKLTSASSMLAYSALDCSIAVVGVQGRRFTAPAFHMHVYYIQTRSPLGESRYLLACMIASGVLHVAD